jgi:hypothetical protein
MAVRAWCPLCDRLALVYANGWQPCLKRQWWKFLEHETYDGKLCGGPEKGV